MAAHGIFARTIESAVFLRPGLLRFQAAPAGRWHTTGMGAPVLIEAAWGLNL